MTNPNAYGPIWLDVARKHVGEREIKGRAHNPKIVQWFADIGASWFKDDETPWCGAFVGGVLKQAGLPVVKNGAAARSWAEYGQPLARPAVGCIVVFSRAGGGHVGFVVGVDQRGNLMVLGGNQGDMVKVSPFDRGRVLAYRWPGTLPLAHRYDLPVLNSNGVLSTNEA